jgi:ribosomal-protein-alanine N-acetyltransferase
MMSQSLYPFRIDNMTLDDIPVAVAIEKAAYLSHFSHRDFEYELQRNRLAHYFSLRVVLPEPYQTHQVGLGGYWLLGEEAHIITIAVDPGWQRLGLGEWLLLHILEHGRTRNARVATLEVRPSNQRGIALYQKYRLKEVGRRFAYYSDNGEDALLLTSPPLDTPEYRHMLTTSNEKLRLRLAESQLDRITIHKQD